MSTKLNCIEGSSITTSSTVPHQCDNISLLQSTSSTPDISALYACPGPRALLPKLVHVLIYPLIWSIPPWFTPSPNVPSINTPQTGRLAFTQPPLFQRNRKSNFGSPCNQEIQDKGNYFVKSEPLLNYPWLHIHITGLSIHYIVF